MEQLVTLTTYSNLQPLNNPPCQDGESLNQFLLYLNDVLSSIRILHWNASDYNFHIYLNKFYNKLSDLFDSLAEEIIGVVKFKKSTFLVQSPERDVQKILNCDEFENQKAEFFAILDSLESMLKNQGMTSFISCNSTGINNLVEEIISLNNNARYLINLIKG